MRKLYPYQEQAVLYGLEHHYHINACEMGLGKSWIALETAKRAGMSPVVFGPTFLKETWAEESKKAGVEILYVNYSMAHRIKTQDISDRKFFIADECHYLQTPNTLRTKAFYTHLTEIKPEYFIGLSGTPIRTRVYNMWTLIAFCGVNPKGTSGKKLQGEHTKYRAFARHFCNVEMLKIRGARIEKFSGIKEDKIPEFKEYLLGKYLRFTVDQVLKDLPTITRKDVTFNMKDTSGLKDMFDAYMSGGKADITAKVISATLKAPFTIEYVKELMEGGSGPLVIFSDHRAPVESISQAIEGSVGITGATGPRERMKAVEDFQAGKISVIVATIGSLSVGVTLHASRHVIFNDLSWTPADNIQAEKRIHRIGQRNACWSHFIHSTPTDKYIQKTLFAKTEAIEKVI